MSHDHTKAAASAVLLSLGIAASAYAQPSSPGTAASTGTSTSGSASSSPAAGSGTSAAASALPERAPLSRSDRGFIEKAARGGLAEIELGQLAQEKAGSEQVKQFGSRLVADHGKANDQLKRIASSRGVELPTRPEDSARRERDKLQRLSGMEFDREFVTHMVSDHKKDIREFESAAKSAKDPDLRKFAADVLPTLREHLQLARSADAATQGSTRSPRGAAAPGASTATGAARGSDAAAK